MTTREKQQKLKAFNNEAEFREFLIDFLRKRGFQDVQHTHRYGSPEQGKDIIARFPHGLDGDDWYSFVVKKGRIGGGTNEIETIKNQIKQSFEYPYKGLDGSELKINKVKVVTNENFTNGAQTQISSSPELKIYSNYSFWWNESLIPIIDEYYPDFWLPGDAFSKEYSKSFTKELQDEIEIRELSIRNIDDKKVQKLLDIFVEPKLTTSEVEEDRKTQEKSVKDKNVSVSSIKEITENLLLSGEQGAGKTKILNTIACNLSKPEVIAAKKQIPVKLKAPDIRDSGFNIEESILHQVKYFGDQFFSEEILQEYKPILFIDDFDLLSKKDKERLISLVKHYCEEKNCHFVLTYRKSEFDYEGTIKKIRIHNFTARQVETFITKFFEGSDRGARFIQVLKESGILSKLPTTPLTVTLLSLLYDEHSFEIPATLSDIYLDFTNVLLGKLDVRNRQELLIYNIKNRLFSALALKMIDEKVFEIEFAHYEKFINEFLTSRGYENQTQEQLMEIIDNSGLLYINDHKKVGFKQQAFIEFFASIEIYHHRRSSHYEKMIKNFNDVVWQNTAIFYAGHSKELDGMITDVIEKSPNEDLKDWFVNSGGMGYLSQALYQTKPTERSKLVHKSLDNLLLAFTEIRRQTEEEGSFVHKMPLPFVCAIISFWFSENFKSITLTSTLESTFDSIFDQAPTFDNNLKLLLISATLMNPYIGKEACFGRLIERKEFMEHPILPLVADLILDHGNIDKKTVSKEQRKLLVKARNRKKDYIRAVLSEPAYRFGEDFALKKKD